MRNSLNIPQVRIDLFPQFINLPQQVLESPLRPLPRLLVRRSGRNQLVDVLEDQTDGAVGTNLGLVVSRGIVLVRVVLQ